LLCAQPADFVAQFEQLEGTAVGRRNGGSVRGGVRRQRFHFLTFEA
jgi:hypothetical protein